ncbi:MAG: tetratricopeptide repeat protein [Ktedonobacterales bacterium]
MDEQSAVHEGLIRDTPAARLGQRLRSARLARNLTQGEVARNLFSVSYVSAVERGQIRPSLGALEKLADRLKVQVTELLGNGDFVPQSAGGSGGIAHEVISERQREDLEARVREARKLARQGTPATVSQAIEILLRLSSQQVSQRELGRIDLLLAQCYLLQGRAEDGRRAAQAGMTVAERLGDRDLAERLRYELGNAYALLQSDSLAEEHYRRNLDAIERGDVQDLTLRLAVLNSLGALYAQKGEAAQALDFLLRASQLAGEVADPQRLGELYWAMSVSHAARGDSAEARQLAQKSIAAFEEANLRRLIASVYQRLGTTYADSGQLDDAVTQLRQASDLAGAQNDPRSRGEAQRALSSVYLHAHKLDAATDSAKNAIAEAETTGDHTGHAAGLLALARVQDEQKRYADARGSYERAIELLRTAGDNDLLGDGLKEFSTFLERRGEQQQAYDTLKQALAVSTKVGAKR